MEILYLEKNVNRVTVQVLKIITLLPVVSTLAANSYANARRGTQDLNAIDAIMDFMEDLIRNVYLATVIHMAAWAINAIKTVANVIAFKESLAEIVPNASLDKYL